MPNTSQLLFVTGYWRETHPHQASLLQQLCQPTDSRPATHDCLDGSQQDSLPGSTTNWYLSMSKGGEQEVHPPAIARYFIRSLFGSLPRLSIRIYNNHIFLRQDWLTVSKRAKLLTDQSSVVIDLQLSIRLPRRTGRYSKQRSVRLGESWAFQEPRALILAAPGLFQKNTAGP